MKSSRSSLDNKRLFTSDEFLEISRELSVLNSLFYTSWRLGKPYFSDEVPTAAVKFDKNQRALEYLFNPDYWEALSLSERVWLVAHEVLHVFFKHSSRFASVDSPELANVACDVSIHEYLFKHLGMSPRDIPKLFTDLCFIENVFKNDPDIQRNQTAEYYYEHLKKEGKGAPKNLRVLTQSGGSADGNAEGITEEELNEIHKMLEMIMSEEESKDANSLIREESSKGRSSPFKTSFTLQNFEVIVWPKQPKWKTLIKKVTHKALKEREVDRWAPKSRRIQAVASEKDFFLPSLISDEDISNKAKPGLFLYLDTSGSCHGESKRFLKAMKSIDLTAFQVKAFTFGDAVSEIDPKGTSLKMWGGTSFDIIENHIKEYTQKHKMLYPDLVFIITDGAGNHVKPEFPNRWHWFLTDYNYKYYIPKESVVHSLHDFELPT